MPKQNKYKKTLVACYLGFITQAIAANFAPLLFVTFQHTYGISLEKIALIPQQTDILVSHCPPFGILDKSAFGANMGNEELRKQVEIINPRYHLFGHIHEAYGVYKTSRTTFVNGAVADANYELVKRPVVITT